MKTLYAKMTGRYRLDVVTATRPIERRFLTDIGYERTTQRVIDAKLATHWTITVHYHPTGLPIFQHFTESDR